MGLDGVSLHREDAAPQRRPSVISGAFGRISSKYQGGIGWRKCRDPIANNQPTPNRTQRIASAPMAPCGIWFVRCRSSRQLMPSPASARETPAFVVLNSGPHARSRPAVGYQRSSVTSLICGRTARFSSSSKSCASVAAAKLPSIGTTVLVLKHSRGSSSP
jgi:hypothetical protein